MLHIKLRQGDILLVNGVAIICSGLVAKISVQGGDAAERVYNCTTIEEINAVRAFQILKIALKESTTTCTRVVHGWTVITTNYPDGHISVRTYLETGQHYYIDSEQGTELKYFINDIQTYLEKQNDIS